jgi:glycosyltransferase involved in cell wall biosynthesis
MPPKRKFEEIQNVEGENKDNLMANDSKESRLLDLNTKLSVSESLQWQPYQAIRELLLNASDEDSESCRCELSSPTAFSIYNGKKGITESHFIYDSNPEKITDSSKSGKFGYGLKDAIVILAARGIIYKAISNHGTFEAVIDQTIATNSKIKIRYSPSLKLSYPGTVQTLEIASPSVIHCSIKLITATQFAEQVEMAKFRSIFFNEEINKYKKKQIYRRKELFGTIYFLKNLEDYKNSKLSSMIFVHNFGYDYSELETENRFLFIYNLNTNKDSLKGRDRETVPPGSLKRIEALIADCEEAQNVLLEIQNSRKDTDAIYELKLSAVNKVLNEVRDLKARDKRQIEANIKSLTSTKEREEIDIQERCADVEHLNQKMTEHPEESNLYKQCEQRRVEQTKEIQTRRESIMHVEEKLQQELTKKAQLAVQGVNVYVPPNFHADAYDSTVYECSKINKVTDKHFTILPSIPESKEMALLSLDQDKHLAKFKLLCKILFLLGLKDNVTITNGSRDETVCFIYASNGNIELRVNFDAFNTVEELKLSLFMGLIRLPLRIFQNQDQPSRLALLSCILLDGVPDQFVYTSLLKNSNNLFLERQFCPMLVCDEWGTSLGGIPAYNMQLALGLTSMCSEVYVLLIGKYDPKKLGRCPENNKVIFVDASFKRNQYIPDLPCPEMLITHIVGHAHITGDHADKISKLPQFQHLKVWQFNHITPRIVDLLKNKSENDSYADKHLASLKKSDKLKLLHGSADYVWSVGNYMYSYWNSSGIEYKHNPVILPLNPFFYNSPTRKSSFGTPRKILFVGRVHEVFFLKGLDIALRSYMDLISSHPEKIRLIVRGISPEEAYEAEKAVLSADQVQLFRSFHSRDVEYRGFGTQCDVLQDLQECDVFIMPSRCEPFGLVATEAIACGVPTFVSKVSGVAELLRDSNCPNWESMTVETCSAAVNLPTHGEFTTVNVTNWSEKLKDFFSVPNPKFPFTNALLVRNHLHEYLESENAYESMRKVAYKELNISPSET